MKAVALEKVEDIAKAMVPHMDGLSPDIIELVAALFSKDREHISRAIGKLGVLLNVDCELIELITHIAMSRFNPADRER